MHVSSKTRLLLRFDTVQVPFIRLDVGCRPSVWSVSVIYTLRHCSFPSEQFFSLAPLIWVCLLIFGGHTEDMVIPSVLPYSRTHFRHSGRLIDNREKYKNFAGLWGDWQGFSELCRTLSGLARPCRAPQGSTKMCVINFISSAAWYNLDKVGKYQNQQLIGIYS